MRRLAWMSTCRARPAPELTNSCGAAAAAISLGTPAAALAAPPSDPATPSLRFPLLPFTKYSSNSIIRPNPENYWESRFVYNPAAIVRDQQVYMLYRAQGPDLVSRIGLATSQDGIHFTRRSEPVMEPTEPYESQGYEDPRVVRIGNTYCMTYTGYNGTNALLCLATSRNLTQWKKYGPLFPDFVTPIAGREWSKSGAILTTPINARYILYFGDYDLYYAWSEDLIHWTPGSADDPVLHRCESDFTERVLEPGPPPLLTEDGYILLIHNAADYREQWGSCTGSCLVYRVGQILISPDQPPKTLAKMTRPFLEPETPDETTGLVNNVVFAEGLVNFGGVYYLYYGGADATINLTNHQPA
jgi:beta-1,2-mannosidase